MRNPRDPHTPTKPSLNAATSASASAKSAVASEPFPCPSCTYDLRGLPSGGRCPECGTRIPARPSRPTASRWLRSDRRDDIAGTWRSLGATALPPIVLISTIPFQQPFGVAIAVCVGFAPAFRLVAIRHLSKLPDDMRFVLKPQIARLHRLQQVELGFVAAVLIYAAAATFGLAPQDAVHAYRALLFGWWMTAASGIWAQLKLGDALARRLVDPSVLPTDEPSRALRRIALSMALVVAAFGLYATAFVLGSAGSGQALAVAAIVVMLVGCGVFAYAAFAALGHANLVTECVYECEALRDAPPSELAEDPLPETPTGSAPHRATMHDDAERKPKRPAQLPPLQSPPQHPPQRPPWDDDDPIPLA